MSDTVKETHGLGWVLLMSGLLHREINAALAFEKLHWDVFTSSLRASLGFKYSKAQAFYFQKGSDGHKLWHVLDIMYLSLVMELMVLYVRGCVSRDVSPTVNDYWDWSQKGGDPSYLYIQESILTYGHSLIILRTSSYDYNDLNVRTKQILISYTRPELHKLKTIRISVPHLSIFIFR